MNSSKVRKNLPLRFRGNVAIIVFTLFVLMSAISASAESINYSYDDMQRLTRAEYGDGTVIDYVYDGSGNRLSKTTTLIGAPVHCG